MKIDSGRDIVVEISGSVVERLILQRVRTSQALSCIPVDREPWKSVLPSLGIDTQGLTHFGVWVVAVRLQQDGGSPTVSLQLRVPPVLASPGFVGIRLVSLPLQSLLDLLDDFGPPVLPTSLPVFDLLDVEVQGKPEPRVVDDGALALGFDVDLGQRRPTSAWDSFHTNFLKGRDWAVAVDAAVIDAFVKKQLSTMVSRSRHPGGMEGPTAVSMVQIAAVDGSQSVQFLRTENLANVPIRDEENRISGFEPRWDIIVPGRFGGSSRFDDLLFYRRANGDTQIFTTDGEGGFQPLRHHTLDGGLDMIVSGRFSGRDRYTDLLVYDRETGDMKFYAGGPDGQLSLSSRFGFGRGLDIIAAHRASAVASPIGSGTGFVTFDRDSREARVYATDGRGNWSELAIHPMQVAWDHMVAIKIGADRGLLFHASDGSGEIYRIGSQGELTHVRSFEMAKRWHLLVAGRFGGSTGSDLVAYDRDDGVARFYEVHENGEVHAFAVGPDWRIGWDLIVPANVAAGARTGLVLYDTSSSDPPVTWEYANGHWPAVTTGGAALGLVHARGEYHDPNCGGIDFEIRVDFAFQIDHFGALGLRIIAAEPDVDFWDGAQAVFCYGLFGGPVGIAVAAGLFVTGSTSLVVDALAGSLLGGHVDGLSGRLLGDAPHVDFTVGNCRFIGDRLEYQVNLPVTLQDPEYLLISGRCQGGDLPAPGRLAVTGRDGRQPQVDVYQRSEHVCRSVGPPYEEHRLYIENRGEGSLWLCGIELIGDPDFYIKLVPVGFASLRTPAGLGVDPSGRSITGLPLSYEPGELEVVLEIAYRGPVGSDATGNLRVISNDADQPLFELPLRAISGGTASYRTDPTGDIVIRAANTERGTDFRLVQDCRGIEHIDSEIPVGALWIENTSDRPLYVCDAQIDEPDVFMVSIIDPLIKPHQTGAIGIYFFPREVMRDYYATLFVRTNLAPPGVTFDIERRVHGRVDAEPGTQKGSVGLGAAVLEYLYDLVNEKLCAPHDADICRTRGLFQPSNGERIEVALLGFSPATPGGDIYLHDDKGMALAHDFSDAPQRQIVIDYPGPDGSGGFVDPCIASYRGMNSKDLDRMRIDVSGRILRPLGSFAGAKNPANVVSAEQWVFVAGPQGLYVIDWHDYNTPKAAAILDLMDITSLALLHDHLIVGAGKDLVVFNIVEPAAPKLVSRIVIGSRILSVAATRDSIYSVDGRRLMLFAWENGRLHACSEQAVPGGAVHLGLSPNGAYVCCDTTLTLLTVSASKLRIIHEAKCRDNIEVLSHYGKSIMVTNARTGTEVFQIRSEGLRRTAEYRRPHWSAPFIPDRGHRQLFRIAPDVVELWGVEVHRLDRRHFEDALRLRYTKPYTGVTPVRRPLRTTAGPRSSSGVKR